MLIKRVGTIQESRYVWPPQRGRGGGGNSAGLGRGFGRLKDVRGTFTRGSSAWWSRWVLQWLFGLDWLLREKITLSEIFYLSCVQSHLKKSPKSLFSSYTGPRDENVESFQWQTEHISGAVYPSLLAEEKLILMDWHLIVAPGSERLFVSKHSHIRWNTLLNLIVNFASTKMMGEFRTQNIRGNSISRYEENEQTVEQNHVYLRIFPPVSK